MRGDNIASNFATNGASWEHCELQTGNQSDAEDRDDAGATTWHGGVVSRREERNAPFLVVGLLAA